MGGTAAEAAQGAPMRCGLNEFGHRCNHRARPDDPLCTDHALLARGRAGLPAGGGKPISLRAVEERLRAAGCDVPVRQGGRL